MHATASAAGEVDPVPQRSNMGESQVRRVEDQTAVHIRSPQVEASQSVTVDKQQELPVSMYKRAGRPLMEVFSVKFLADQHVLEKMHGSLLISTNPTYVAFSRKGGAPLNITREGFVKLRGPNKAMEAADHILIYPCLYKYKEYEAQCDQFTENDDVMWTYVVDNFFDDRFLSKTIQSHFGPIQVNYAVYTHGVEARVGVSMTLTGCQLSSAVVYGMITAHNSDLGVQATSFLFNRDKTEGIRIDVSPHKGNATQLPLLRSKTVHPINSVVTIIVNMWQCNVMETEDQQIAEEMTFEFTNLRGRNVMTSEGNACQVNVGITWAETRGPPNPMVYI